MVLFRLPSKIGQYILFSKDKLNNDFKLTKLIFGRKFANNSFKVIKEVNNIPFDQNFILSGLNLALLGYYLKESLHYANYNTQ